MNCKKVRHNLPLLAAQDLSKKRGLRLQKHLDGCAGCRKEVEEYKTALQGIKNLAEKEGLKSWDEAEWKAAIKRATSGAAAPKKAASRRLIDTSLTMKSGEKTVVGVTMGTGGLYLIRALKSSLNVPCVWARCWVRNPMRITRPSPYFAVTIPAFLARTCSPISHPL